MKSVLICRSHTDQGPEPLCIVGTACGTLGNARPDAQCKSGNQGNNRAFGYTERSHEAAIVSYSAIQR